MKFVCIKLDRKMKNKNKFKNYGDFMAKYQLERKKVASGLTLDK